MAVDISLPGERRDLVAGEGAGALGYGGLGGREGEVHGGEYSRPTADVQPAATPALRLGGPGRCSHGPKDHRHAVDLDKGLGIEEAGDAQQRHRRVVAPEVAAPDQAEVAAARPIVCEVADVQAQLDDVLRLPAGCGERGQEVGQGEGQVLATRSLGVTM